MQTKLLFLLLLLTGESHAHNCYPEVPEFMSFPKPNQDLLLPECNQSKEDPVHNDRRHQVQSFVGRAFGIEG